MLMIVHLLVGAVIGKYLNNFWVVLPVALLSHYFLDMIPHRSMPTPHEYKTRGLKGISTKLFLLESIEPVLGIVLTILLIFYFNNGKEALMFIGAFFAWFPDLITFVVWKKDWKHLDQYLPRPGTIWYNKSKSLIGGILVQIIIGAIAILAITFF